MISTRERRIAWVAGIVIGAFALDSLIVSPLLDRQTSAQARVVNATQQLDRADGLFKNKLKAQEVWNEMAGDTLKVDPPQAESQLLNSARDWAQTAGLSLTSLKQERMELEQGFGKITVRASATGDMQALGRFLYEIQSAAIPVRVVDITVNSRREGTDDLTVQVGLATIYRPPAAPDPRGSRREVRP
jgi:hypothetical protein